MKYIPAFFTFANPPLHIMSNNKAIYLSAVEQSLKDDELRKKITQGSLNHQNAFEEAQKQYLYLETAKERAAFTRWKAIENLDKYLIEFESNFIKSGGKVIWALNAQDATEEVLKIVNREAESIILKSKSMMTEEIGLNKALQKNKHEVIENDLGQFILQASHDTASHMVMPIMHKSSKEIIEFYKTKFSKEVDDSVNKLETPEDVVRYTRSKLREKFKNAYVGITGANFIVADAGAISITENEGNALLTAGMPKVHIVIAGIDKIIPSLNDLDLLLPLLSSYGTGQPLTVYNTIVNGPARNGEKDGPGEMFVILVDNNRTKVLSNEIQRQSLHCVHCGSCMLADPVYRVIGGHAYGNIYNGPYGAAILPYKEELKEFFHLSEANPLDGAGSEACPVKIDFNKLFLHSRKEVVDKQINNKAEKWFYFFWKKSMVKRNLIKLKGIKTLSYFVNATFNKSEEVTSKNSSIKSFNDQWREKMKIN